MSGPHRNPRRPEHSSLGECLLRDGRAELVHLRRIRGVHRRTARRIARVEARLALGAFLLAASQGAAAGVPRFFDPLEAFGILDVSPIGGGARPAFVDIEGDGDLDLFVGNPYGKTVGFQNDGASGVAAFAPTAPFGLTDVGFDAAPAFADLDADGDFDAVVASDSRSFFFANTGAPNAPAFAPPVADPFGLERAARPAFLDGDADGDLDAVAAFGGLGTVLFENTGTPQAPAFLSPFDPFGLASSEALADIDGDGDLDSFASDGFAFRFAENTGSAQAPAFAAPVADPFGLFGEDYAGVGLADLDGDGDLDLVSRFYLYSTNNRIPVWFENTGGAAAPAFAFNEGKLLFGSFFYSAMPSFADIDGDGDMDSLLSHGDYYTPTPTTTVLFENTGPLGVPSFAAPASDPFGLPGTDRRIWRFVDADSDGDSDILLSDSSAFHLLAENTGTTLEPAFAAAAPSPFGVGGLFLGPTGDLDGDGDLDVLSNLGGGLLFLENAGTAGEPAFPLGSFGLVGGSGGAAPALGDLDGDGDLDAVAGWRTDSPGAYTGFVTVLENTGAAGLPAFVPIGEVGPVFSGVPALADLDGDADLDLLLGLDGGRSLFLENAGSAQAPAFVSPVHPFGLAPTVSLGAGALADFDGDGDLDYFAGTYDDGLKLFENTGSAVRPAFAGGSGSPFAAYLGTWPTPTFGDLDDDGDPDLVAAGRGYPRVVGNGGSAGPPGSNQTLYAVGWSRWVTLGDLDGDGDLDVLAGDFNGALGFSENTGSPKRFEFSGPVDDPFGLASDQITQVPAVVDVEGDGDLDLFVGGDDGKVRFFENTGSPSAPAFAPAVLHAFGIGGVDQSLAALTFGDLDGDGDLDALVGVGERSLFLENEELAPPCPPTPEPSCTSGFAKARLAIDERKRGREALRLELRKGPALVQGAFGDPRTPDGTEYGICLYDDADRLAAALRLARAGESCGAAPCWKAVGKEPPDGKGYAYRDAAGAAHGLRSLRLDLGAGKASLAALSRNPKPVAGTTARPRGAAAALEGAAAVTVQLRTSDAACFSAELSEVRKSTSEVFKAR